MLLRSASAARPVNRNPALDRLSIDGVAIAADGTTTLAAGKKLTLDPVPSPESKEETPDAGGEKLNYSFFATAGTLSELRSADTTATGQPGATTVDYTAPATPGPVRLWVVIRDGRGGVGWLERRLQIAVP